MILPTTYVSALLLLVLSFLALGSWINTFKLAGKHWRFELFSIDFAIGALLLAVIAAFTLGSLGSDLAFTDRMLVAGHTAQAIMIGAGFIFNLGNMLLLAAASLLGLAGAFPLSIGVALIVASCFGFHSGNWLFLISGIVLLGVAVFLDANACRARAQANAKKRVPAHASAATNAQTETGVSREAMASSAATAAATAKSRVSTVVHGGTRVAHNSAPRKGKSRRTARGLLIAVLSGIALGLFYPVASRGPTGEFSLGPYASLLMLSVGVLISTIIYNFYFLNISIDAEPVSFGAYFKGNARQHFLGFLGGALWASGMLAAALALSVPSQTGPNPALQLILPVGSVLLVMLWGAVVWKEFPTAAAKLAIGLVAVFFTAGLVLLGIGIAR